MNKPLTLTLPPGLREAIDRLAQAQGVTPEQFLASAAAEKVGALTDAQLYFAQRAKTPGAIEWFDRFMSRAQGEPPSAEDALSTSD